MAQSRGMKDLTIHLGTWSHCLHRGSYSTLWVSLHTSSYRLPIIALETTIHNLYLIPRGAKNRENGSGAGDIQRYHPVVPFWDASSRGLVFDVPAWCKYIWRVVVKICKRNRVEGRECTSATSDAVMKAKSGVLVHTVQFKVWRAWTPRANMVYWGKRFAHRNVFRSRAMLRVWDIRNTTEVLQVNNFVFMASSWSGRKCNLANWPFRSMRAVLYCTYCT